ncbi:MAG TPA: EamA family transporter, partial [Tistrella mobilis]|nr:EamA family transporter [Tistrella mobilis]
TAAAAALQASRTALQQRLRGLLSVQGAGFVRYAYGAPVSLAALGVVAASPAGVPDLTLAHAGWCALAG